MILVKIKNDIHHYFWMVFWEGVRTTKVQFFIDFTIFL